MAFWNRKYKDSVFTDLFGSDRDGKKNFLELYNALAGTDYKLEEVTRIYERIVPVRKRYAEKVYKIPNPNFTLFTWERKSFRPNRSCGFPMHFTKRTVATWSL